ncbi:MAG: calcium/sodium antiporter [Phycisphaerales bacterium]
MLTDLLILVASVGVTVLGAEALVRGSVRIARRLGLSSLFIGMTIVGFGTSTPELGASVAAAWRGAEGIAVGNVVGSNICNIALILGAAALVRPLAVSFPIVRREICFAALACALPFLAVLAGSVVTRPLAAVLLVVLAWSVWDGWRRARAQTEAERAALPELEREVAGDRPGRAWTAPALVVIGLGLLVVGSRLLVDSAVGLAGVLGVPDVVIGLTIVAMGTSAPEVVTSIVAARRGETDLAVGNVVGSNVFNALGILGIASLVRPQAVPGQVLMVDLPVSVVLMALLLPLVRSGARISRAEGAVLLTLYGLYLAFQFAVAPRLFGA